MNDDIVRHDGEDEPYQQFSGLQPQIIITVGHGCYVGITWDDGCLVALIPEFLEGYSPDTESNWRPLSWVPPKVAMQMGAMASSHCKEVDCS